MMDLFPLNFNIYTLILYNISGYIGNEPNFVKCEQGLNTYEEMINLQLC